MATGRGRRAVANRGISTSLKWPSAICLIAWSRNVSSPQPDPQNHLYQEQPEVNPPSRHVPWQVAKLFLIWIGLPNLILLFFTSNSVIMNETLQNQVVDRLKRESCHQQHCLSNNQDNIELIVFDNPEAKRTGLMCSACLIDSELIGQLLPV